MRQYTIVLIPDLDEGGFTVIVPALPGLVAQGESREDALQMAREAISFHLECLEAEGEAIPDGDDVEMARIDVPVA